MDHQTATKNNQQIIKKLGHKDINIFGTGLSQTTLQFSLLIVFVKDNFAKITIIFLISDLT